MTATIVKTLLFVAETSIDAVRMVGGATVSAITLLDAIIIITVASSLTGVIATVRFRPAT
jgi:hypothetical protein